MFISARSHCQSPHSCKQRHMRSPSDIPERRSIRATTCQRTALIVSAPTEQGWSDTCGGLACPVPRRRHRAPPKASESPEHLPRIVAFIQRTLRTTLRAPEVWGMRRNQASPHRCHNHLVYLVLLQTALVRLSPFTTGTRRYPKDGHKVRAARLSGCQSILSIPAC
jgi:hypothetical protein